MSESPSRLIVVTGSASGIGAATARLAAQDARVIGVDRHDADVCVDLSTPDGRTGMVEEVRSLSDGAVDAVIACAGVASDAAVAVNYFGMVATLIGLRSLLIGSAAPRAAGVASLASIHPVDQETVDACLRGDEASAQALSLQSGSAYASSKAAFSRWVRRAAPSAEWAGAGIPLNCVSPGTVVTPLTAPMLADRDQAAYIDSVVPMPLNGHAQPEAVASLLLWLVSTDNSHVTGQNIFIDGGADAVLRGDTTW